ncbi:extracellular solute-binding protein [Paracoccus sp. (in: a-proteobacteria)]|uniref:extracellular solute-binding protein n=1 Tax=Paracoccus sp. TaxID=267 RepID=UPI00321F79BD
MRIFKFADESAIWRRIALCVCVASMPLASPAEPMHAIAMYGEPALAPGFSHLPYANPDAPQGGTIRLAESGTFDSLNPWILMGNPVWPIFTQPGLVTESLMMRSIDEPFTLYGLLAESVETDPDRTWVEFTLRPEARFSDGTPVTVEDVIWSYETLGTVGHPRYTAVWSKVAKLEQTGPRRVRFSFNTADRELALLMGMRPILKKAQWQGRDFSQSGLMAPIGSGPYVVGKVDPGRAISFRRNPDYWGRDLAVSRGLHNFDEIRYDYFGDANAMFEAFKAGEIDVWRELVAARWDSNFDFPAVRDGRVVKSEIAHQRPSGIMGLVMNSRNPLFADWRVRQAMIEAFNFQFINMTLSGGKDPRIASYFSNSDLAMTQAPASGRVAELLAPFAATLPPGAIQGYALPEGGDRAIDRKGIRAALQLLSEAGWHVQEGELRDARGRPFAFEILLNQSGSAMRSSAETRQIVDIFVESLRNLGIHAQVTLLDAAQYVQRTNNYQFDMTWYERGLSLAPGNEQMLYWGHEGVAKPGSKNWMGMDSPAAEAMIAEMGRARTREDYLAAVQALDRILTAGRYVIPVSYSRISRLAHKSDLHYPEKTPLYGDWPGFMPETWWHEERK